MSASACWPTMSRWESASGWHWASPCPWPSIRRRTIEGRRGVTRTVTRAERGRGALFMSCALAHESGSLACPPACLVPCTSCSLDCAKALFGSRGGHHVCHQIAPLNLRLLSESCSSTVGIAPTAAVQAGSEISHSASAAGAGSRSLTAISPSATMPTKRFSRLTMGKRRI